MYLSPTISGERYLSVNLRALGVSISTQFEIFSLISTRIRSEPKKMTCVRNALRGREALIWIGRRQLVLGGPDGDLGSRPEPKLVEYPSDVIAGSALGDPKFGGDLE